MVFLEMFFLGGRMSYIRMLLSLMKFGLIVLTPALATLSIGNNSKNTCRKSFNFLIKLIFKTIMRPKLIFTILDMAMLDKFN